ncbi:16244_t:CDS:2, partial [Racocetra fulgida]
GSSTIYSATWIDGKRNYSWDKPTRRLIKTREQFCKVALKNLTGTQNVSLDFLDEKLREWTMILDKTTEKKKFNDTFIEADENVQKLVLDEGTEELYNEINLHRYGIANELSEYELSELNTVFTRGQKDYLGSLLRTAEVIKIHQDIEEAKKLSYEELKIKNAFLKADEIIFSRSKTLEQHPDLNYTSELEIDEIIFSQSKILKQHPDTNYTSRLETDEINTQLNL